jgi:transcriptional regulator
MYVPRHFDASDRDWCHALIGRESFATVVTTGADGMPFATHVPLELEPERGPLGTLVGHVARANPHVELLRAGRPTLVVFAGPHAYVSPSWYARHPAVPTWNYVAVHATGVPAVVEDGARVRALLERVARRYEGDGDGAWTLAALPDDYLAGMVRGIVAFEVPIERLEGKAKLSQNRPADDRRRVADALAASADAGARAVGALVRAAPSR